MATKKLSANDKQFTQKYRAALKNEGTVNIENNDLAARLKRYRDRTGEYSNKKGGANFTVPTAGQPTGQKRAAARSNNQSARNTGSGQPMRNTGRSVPVQGPLPRESYNFNDTTGNRSYVQQPPVNANPQRPSMFGGSGQAYQPQSPLSQPQSPLAQPQGGQYSVMFPQMANSPMAPTMPQAQAGGYQAPSPFRNYDQFGRDYQSSGMQFMNPWGRRW